MTLKTFFFLFLSSVVSFLLRNFHSVYFLFRSQKMRNFMFFLSSFLLVLALHATIERNISVEIASFCILIGRPLIAFSVSWFIITNACGYNCKTLTVIIIVLCIFTIFLSFSHFLSVHRLDLKAFFCTNFCTNK
jgi:hypothetical protein